MNFTYSYLKNQFRQIIESGYEFLRCIDYVERKESLPPLTLVNRIDIDLSVKKTEKIVDIFNELGIKGTFFLRLHAPEYNPLSFESYRIIRKLIDSGHELSYHSEVIDQATIWNEDPEQCLKRDIQTIQTVFGIKIHGVASHGGMTGLNNLDFWKNRKPSDFGLLYEAYDREPTFNLFHESLYISDSEWTQWKCYKNGKMVKGDMRSPAEHCLEKPPLVYLLIHPDTYYNRHFYE